MTNAQFRAWLTQFPDDATVLAWDPDADGWFPITGATYEATEIRLYTDSDEDEEGETP